MDEPQHAVQLQFDFLNAACSRTAYDQPPAGLASPIPTSAPAASGGGGLKYRLPANEELFTSCRRSCGRTSFETLRVRRDRDPGLCRSGPDMPPNIEPVGIVEGASGNPAHARPSFNGPHDGGAAPRTEVHSEPAIAFVGTMLVSHHRSTGHLDPLHFEEDRLRKCTTGSPLAEPAVADRRQHRHANSSIAHAA